MKLKLTFFLFFFFFEDTKTNTLNITFQTEVRENCLALDSGFSYQELKN